jgi:hypothetical protein
VAALPFRLCYAVPRHISAGGTAASLAGDIDSRSTSCFCCSSPRDPSPRSVFRVLPCLNAHKLFGEMLEPECASIPFLAFYPFQETHSPLHLRTLSGTSNQAGPDRSVMPPAANRATGFALVAFGVTLLASFLYAAVLSKVLPPSDNWFLLAVRNDRFAFSRYLTSPGATVQLLSPFVLRSARAWFT